MLTNRRINIKHIENHSVVIWAIDNLELEIVKKFGSMDLTLIKEFGSSKIPEVFIVGDHFDKVFYSLEF